MHDHPILSIIVVSYNTRDVTLDCLRSVFTETRETEFELIVVDNASSDGSAEAIRAEFPQIRLMTLQDNLGFAAANNLAVKEASGNYLLLLNPDTLLQNSSIDRLMAFARQQPQARIWGGRTLFGDGSLNPTSCWREMSLWSQFCWATGLLRMAPNSPIFNPAAYGGWKRDSVRQVDIITGCFLLIARQDWETLGGFDKAFFMYGEEADLCRRARRDLGARPMITPQAEIIHYGGLSDTVRAAKMERLIRAKITFAEKHWSPLRSWLCRQIFRLLVLVRLTAYSLQAWLKQSDSARSNADTWLQIWQTRKTWLQGYSDGHDDGSTKTPSP